jgi:hypothetical protein
MEKGRLLIGSVPTGAYANDSRKFSGMTDAPSPQSPLALLVIFMICLAIGGSAVGAAHYYAIDLPAQIYAYQQNLQPPHNGGDGGGMGGEGGG